MKKASVELVTGQSTANTALVLSTPSAGIARILHVEIVYSAAPVQTGVSVEIDAGAGAAFDATLITGDANVRNTSWIPDGDLLLPSGDALRVTAPAGGAGITSVVSIYMEMV